MREYISLDGDANRIRLKRSTFSGTFLLVEGSTDKVFYERFVHETDCVLHSVSGKPSSKLRVIAVLEILEKDKFQGILGIVDADFDRLNAPSPSNPNLLRTDTHDLETMLFQSPALNKLIAEFGSEEKISKLGKEVRIALLEAVMVIGYLRWISQCDGLNLTFDGIKFSKFIDEPTLQINELDLIQEVQNKSQAFSLKTEDLQQRIIRQRDNSHDPWQVCCGHDLMEVLSLGLRKAIGSAKASDVEPNCLERSLRLAYEEAYFSQTQLCADIHTWENNHQPFKVLKYG